MMMHDYDNGGGGGGCGIMVVMMMTHDADDGHFFSSSQSLCYPLSLGQAIYSKYVGHLSGRWCFLWLQLMVDSSFMT